jgi:hypothetical protein
MSDVKFTRGIEQVGKDALPDERACRQRGHELLCRFGEDAAHGDVALFQPPDQIQRFIGGNAATDDEQDALGAAWRLSSRNFSLRLWCW